MPVIFLSHDVMIADGRHANTAVQPSNLVSSPDRPKRSSFRRLPVERYS